MARPPKINDEMLEKIEQLAEKGVTVTSMESLLGLSSGLLSRYWAKGENQKGIGYKVFQAIKKGRAKLELSLLQELHDVVKGKKKNPYWTLAARWLEALGVWGSREAPQIEHRQINITIKGMPTRQVDENGEIVGNE